MDDDTRDDLLRRLTALVIKIDERDDRLVAMLERHDAMLEELRALNRQQVQINTEVSATLASVQQLVREVFRERHNGHEGP